MNATERHSWQARILALLAERAAVALTSAVAASRGGLTRAEYNALTRAAHRLAARGEIVLLRTLDPDSTGRANVRLVAIRRDIVESLREEGHIVVSGPNGTVTTRRLPGSLRSIGARLRVSKTTAWCDTHARRGRVPTVDEIGQGDTASRGGGAEPR